MNPWLAVALALLPPLLVGAVLCCRGPEAGRFAALQFVGPLGAWGLVIMSFVLDQSSSIDVALMYGFLGFLASLLYAVFVERWL